MNSLAASIFHTIRAATKNWLQFQEQYENKNERDDCEGLLFFIISRENSKLNYLYNTSWGFYVFSLFLPLRRAFIKFERKRNVGGGKKEGIYVHTTNQLGHRVIIATIISSPSISHKIFTFLPLKAKNKKTICKIINAKRFFILPVVQRERKKKWRLPVLLSLSLSYSPVEQLIPLDVIWYLLKSLLLQRQKRALCYMQSPEVHIVVRPMEKLKKRWAGGPLSARPYTHTHTHTRGKKKVCVCLYVLFVSVRDAIENAQWWSPLDWAKRSKSLPWNPRLYEIVLTTGFAVGKSSYTLQKNLSLFSSLRG